MQVNRIEPPLPRRGGAGEGVESLKYNKKYKGKLFLKHTPPFFCCFVCLNSLFSLFLAPFLPPQTYKRAKNRGGVLYKYHFSYKNKPA